MGSTRKTVLTALRLIGLILLLAVVALAIWSGEAAIDRMIRPLCPQGWWHTSQFWAHCAYPPASISKYALMYGAFAALSLPLIHYLAPAFRPVLSRLLLSILIALPAYHLLLVKFSWVEAAKLVVVVMIGVVYEGTRARRAARQSAHSIARSG